MIVWFWTYNIFSRIKAEVSHGLCFLGLGFDSVKNFSSALLKEVVIDLWITEED